MFTEGLDPHALQWIREQRTDSLHGRSNGGRGLGIPLPEKFRSGHLPRTIPLSRTMPVEEYSELGSDMDDSSDTDEEIYGVKYSIDFSPSQNSLSRRSIRNGGTRAGQKIAFYSDCYSDYSSSVEAAGKPVRQQWKQGSMSGCTEEDEDGSLEICGNSDFGRSVGRGEVDGFEDRTRGRFTEESCSSKSHFLNKEEVSAAKGRPVDIPSAPPFLYSQDEICQPIDTVTNSKHNQNISSGSTGIETSETSKFSSLKVPTFHACGQGHWHSVLAYDACVRLCLHSWARGCMEAPIFLENECSLLRNAFGLQYILLQSEEELLEKRSSEPEGASVKPKKIIGKMKVQARKVKMTLDMPSGCNYLSLRTPTVKLESFRYRMSNFQSALSSGWESLQGIRVFPHLPSNSSFSKQSLAYMQATTQYIKHFSVFLKLECVLFGALLPMMLCKNHFLVF
ncbi:hypothetical protein KSP40_PGU018169 [Platanthera guangdongensis]|uniref:Uncharacterized protein n=1 Tax=Platanthera guangdongensis TaxID=2320717 RepID=A0ABR2LHB9_9ASPA